MNGTGFSPLELLSQNTAGGLEKFIPNGSGSWNPRTLGLKNTGHLQMWAEEFFFFFPEEILLPGSWMAVFLLCLHMI